MVSVVDMLDSLRAAVEACAVTDPVSEDDTFRTFTLGAPVRRQSRSVLVTATPPIRNMPGSTCTDFATTVSLAVSYSIGQAEEGQRTVYERALLDSEAIAVALYAWAAAGNVLTLTLAEGEISPDGDGALICERSATIVWQRG